MSGFPDHDDPPLEIDPETAARTLAAEGSVLLDVREPHEFAAGRIAGALHVPLAELARAPDLLPRDETVVVVCLAGVRSKLAAEALRVDGIRATSMVGGLARWASEDRPLDGEVVAH